MSTENKTEKVAALLINAEIASRPRFKGETGFRLMFKDMASGQVYIRTFNLQTNIHNTSIKMNPFMEQILGGEDSTSLRKNHVLFVEKVKAQDHKVFELTIRDSSNKNKSGKFIKDIIRINLIEELEKHEPLMVS